LFWGHRPAALSYILPPNGDAGQHGGRAIRYYSLLGVGYTASIPWPGAIRCVAACLLYARPTTIITQK